jgi:hypothetical protein
MSVGCRTSKEHFWLELGTNLWVIAGGDPALFFKLLNQSLGVTIVWVKHLEKILSVFGAHLILFMNILRIKINK